MYNSGFRSKSRAPDGVGTVAAQASFVQKSDPQPYISGWSIQGLDDRALNPAGGQTVVVSGGGFQTGMTVTVGTTAIGAVTIVSSSQITFTSPAKTSGNYTLTIANSNGQAALLVPGLAYSTIVSWTTSSGSVGTTYETTAYTESVVATSDSSITYTLASGSLPPGATLNANGTITGTSSATSSPTTYSFSITATDAELQDSTQSFTLTVTPDVVTWVSPANNTSYSVTGNQPIANVTLSATSAVGSGITYTANALPTGLSLTGNTISGTPTVAQTVSTLLTATANTTTRSSTETISWTITLGDIYWPNVSLLMNGSTLATSFINDASLNNAQLTIAGDTKPNNNTPYSSGYYSNYFGGSTSEISNSSSTSATALGSGDYTIECWAFANTVSDGLCIFSTTGANNSYSFILRYNGTTAWQLYYGQTNATNYNFNSTNSGNNQWVHHAIVRASGTLSWYINGVRVYTVADSYNMLDKGIEIGNYAGYFWNGYISNFRMVRGTAVYTGSSFTVPTAPLTAISGTTLLTCQSNRFIDTSSTNLSWTISGTPMVSTAIPFVASSTYATYGSGYFDGSGDYLVAPAKTSYDTGTGTSDFTIEGWVYNLGYSGSQYGRGIITFYPSAGYASSRLLIRLMSTSNSFNLYLAQGGTTYFGTSGTGTTNTAAPNQWTHFALVRSSGVFKFYINGVLDTTISNQTTVSLSTYNQFDIGRTQEGTSPEFYGNIADVRYTKGTAVYTTNFTPPTAPLTVLANTQLLTCQYNGGASNNGFVDQSSFNNIITRAGNATQGTFDPYGNNFSNYFNGSTDYLSLSANAAFANTGDYTFECWIYQTSAVTSLIFDNYTASSTGAGNNRFTIFNTGFIRWNYDGSSNLSSNAGTVSLNTWTHIAGVRSGTSLTLYINGVSQATGTFSGAIGRSDVGVGIGSVVAGGASFFPGYISNLRIVKGTAIYTSAFTPPTTPLTAVAKTQLLTCQSNRFIDSSSNNFAITKNGDVRVQKLSPFGTKTLPTYYSNYFDGTGDYLTVPASSAFALGTAAYTIETWVNFNSLASYRTIFDVYSASGGPKLTIMSTGALRLWNGSNDYETTATGLISTGTWYHVAWVRESTSLLKLYLNGTSVITVTTGPVVATNVTGTPSVNIGLFGGFTHYMDGYISNLRIVKGTALYTTDFTPPTAPLTAVSGTQLLTCQSSTLVDNSTNYFAITANGDTKPLAVSPFTPTASSLTAYSPATFSGSMYFDGIGDYLTSANLDPLRFGTSNFTMEFWFYPTKINAAMVILSTKAGGTQSGDVWIATDYIGASSTILYIKGGGADFSVTYNGPLVNLWTNIAIVRNGANVYVYVNGTNIGSSVAGTQGTTYFSAINIGGGSGLPAAGYECMTGYLSDFRITNGTALYTANFYPGASPLTPTQTISTTTYASNLLLNGTSGGAIDWSRSANFETVGDAKSTQFSPYSGSYYSVNFATQATENSIKTSGANVSLGSGNFTVECWVNQTGSSDGRAVFMIGTSSNALALYQYGATQLGIAGYAPAGTNVFASTGLATFTLGAWDHHAIVRNNGTVTWYKNGVSIYSVANSTNFTQTGASIGYWAATGGWLGYISNLRVVVGTAVYTTAFTPPTGPLTAISGTQLLACQSNKFIENSSNNYALTVTGTPLVVTQNPFQQNTGKSLYFDGTGDYLTAPYNIQYQMVNEDFTIEAWVYRNVVGAEHNIAVTRSSASSDGWNVRINSSNTLQFYFTGGGSVTSTGTIPAGVWTYITVVKSGNTAKLYINGVNDGTNAAIGTGTANSQALRIGVDNSNAAGYMNGYISDLRITKGVARYSTTFTPPTTPDQLI